MTGVAGGPSIGPTAGIGEGLIEGCKKLIEGGLKGVVDTIQLVRDATTAQALVGHSKEE